jgi:hypothetical protein
VSRHVPALISFFFPASEYKGKRLEVKLKPTGSDSEHFYKSLDIDLLQGQASGPTVQIMAAV